jgi:hypothetical protein
MIFALISTRVVRSLGVCIVARKSGNLELAAIHFVVSATHPLRVVGILDKVYRH